MRSVELFTGVGGLAYGLELAGFRHEVLVEWERQAYETLEWNRQRIPMIRHWRIVQSDVRQFDYGWIGEDIDLLAAGPPCQPFSVAGLRRGHLDERDMFPEVFRAVRELKPKFVLIENVRGLATKKFANYLSYILLQLSYPDLVQDSNETLIDHLRRLERHHMVGGSREGLHYKVVFRVLNAADYGVPQKRERLIIVGVRGDLDVEWSFPQPTHSLDSLLWSQGVTGEYWKHHNIPPRDLSEIDKRAAKRLEYIRDSLLPPDKYPWVTTRDALSDLPDWHGESNAKPYPGHTGSDPDMPAKTLKAGVHGVPGGENCVRLSDGSLRYFTVREMARLQTFPDTFEFLGAWSTAARHLGNAVPVRLAEVLGLSIRQALEHSFVRRGKSYGEAAQ